jgi:diguanylate cyclase (GGDEF)-like protein
MSMNKASVFIVDDGRDNILILSALLRTDYEVYSATSGEEALGRIHEVRPDLVLLDIMMPGMDGYAVLKALQDDPSTANIPVIFISAMDEDQDETKGLELGAVDYITKPIRAPILKARVRNHIELKCQRDLLHELSSIDGLTGLPNRRSLDERLQNEWKTAMRYKSPLSLLMMDIDYFKKYNDFYGHQQGDDCLKGVASALEGTLRRQTDFLARYGGEEFVYLLPDTDEVGVKQYVDHVLKSVRDLQAPHKESDVSDVVSVSIGVATAIPKPGAQELELLALADKAMYQAKRDGRNRSATAVTVHPLPPKDQELREKASRFCDHEFPRTIHPGDKPVDGRRAWDMQLSEHELKPLDDKTIRSLQAEKSRTLSLKLLADLKEAHDRLNQAPDNSSRPPSSRAPRDRVSADAQDDREGDDGEPGAPNLEQEGAEEAQTSDPSTGPEDK